MGHEVNTDESKASSKSDQPLRRVATVDFRQVIYGLHSETPSTKVSRVATIEPSETFNRRLCDGMPNCECYPALKGWAKLTLSLRDTRLRARLLTSNAFA